jgi:hypothetical protein
MSSRQLMAIVAGAVTAFILGFLLYGLALANFMVANAGTATGVMRDPPMWLPLVLGQFPLAILLSIIIARWPGATGFGGGMKVGAIVGLLMALGFDLTMFATTNISNLTMTLVDPPVTMVLCAITGGVIAAIQSKAS